MSISRRRFVSHGTLGVLAYQFGGSVVLMSPKDARAKSVALQTLSPTELRIVEALGDTLLPGAAQDGLAYYLDQQLSVSPAQSLLMLRYLDIPPPYAAFYKPCLAAVESSARAQHGQSFDALSVQQRTDFVAAMQKADPQAWQGPPAPLFYFVLRSDAVDVVYGTEAGFEKLGVPYMAHIAPSSKW